MAENDGLSFLANNPVETPSRASPPIIKGIIVKLIYSPPTAPVSSPAHGPARKPLINMGSCVKCIWEGKGPAEMGIAKGTIDRIFDRAAIRAANANSFACPKFKPR